MKIRQGVQSEISAHVKGFSNSGTFSDIALEIRNASLNETPALVL